jgi:PPOX class probable F420-dependent enzyme
VDRLDDDTRAFVDRQRVAHLATATADGLPHVVPICFALEGERLYIAIDDKPKRGTPNQLRRVRNILANPRVSIVVDVYSEDWSRLGFVLIAGTARLIDAGDEHVLAIGALRARYPQYRAMALERRPIIAVDIARTTTWGTTHALRPTRVDRD